MRTFQIAVGEFRAFSFPSGRSVDELKKELEDFRVKLEEESFKLQVLLQELDKAETVKQEGWEDAFTANTSKAELCLQTVSHFSVVTELDFRAKSETARDAYQRAIDAVRQMLTRELSKP